MAISEGKMNLGVKIRQNPYRPLNEIAEYCSQNLSISD